MAVLVSVAMLLEVWMCKHSRLKFWELERRAKLTFCGLAQSRRTRGPTANQSAYKRLLASRVKVASD